MLVVLVAVISIDGCLTRHHDEGASWASAADKQHFASALADADVYLMGSATYTEARDKIRQRLDRGHRRIIITRTPEKYEHDTVSGQLEFTSDPPRQIVDRMRADGHRRCAVLGGGEIYNLFLGSGVVDELQLTLEPRVFGDGKRLAGTSSAIDPQLALSKVDHLSDDTLLLTYRRSE